MNPAKALAGVLALNRAAFGLNYVVRPQEAQKSWIGPVARVPATQVIVRSQGARDVALGGGALRALARGDRRELRAWVAGQTLSDLTDFLATRSARRRLPKKQARLATIVAGVSTVVGAAALAGLSRPERSEEPSVPRSA
jgi:Domain of unknown function (DUF4267)